LLGIPLTGVMLLGLGEKLKFIVYSVQNRKCTKYEKTESLIKHIVLNVFVVGLLTSLPALVFHQIEDWTYWESLYYCFITLFTIGFGDFVAASNAEQNYKALYKFGFFKRQKKDEVEEWKRKSVAGRSHEDEARVLCIGLGNNSLKMK
ncbi:potassium 10 channel subfamily k member, partial [Mytilus galloprovincialis]